MVKQKELEIIYDILTVGMSPLWYKSFGYRTKSKMSDKQFEEYCELLENCDFIKLNEKEKLIETTLDGKILLKKIESLIEQKQQVKVKIKH